VDRWLTHWRRLTGGSPVAELAPANETAAPDAIGTPSRRIGARRRLFIAAAATLVVGAAVAAGGDSGTVASLRSSGGTARSTKPSSAPPKVTVRSAADIDGDGRADLVALSPGTDGTGRYRQYYTDPVRHRLTAGVSATNVPFLASRNTRMITGDVDGDGRLDTVILSRAEPAPTADGAGADAGAPQAGTGGTAGNPATGSVTQLGVLARNAKSVSPIRSVDEPFDAATWAAADLDGDGAAELVALSNGPGGMLTLTRYDDAKHDFALLGRGAAGAPVSSPAHLIVADVTGDRQADILLLYKAPSGGTTVVLVAPDLMSSRVVATLDTPFDGQIQWAAGDTDGDGRADLLSLTDATPYDSYREYAAQADGSFTPGRRAINAPYLPGAGTRMVVADFTGDGDADVLLLTRHTTNGRTDVWSMTGDRQRVAFWVATDQPFDSTAWNFY
jgi:hypothetical protein